jgi:hypothetical protein
MHISFPYNICIGGVISIQVLTLDFLTVEASDVLVKNLLGRQFLVAILARKISLAGVGYDMSLDVCRLSEGSSAVIYEADVSQRLLIITRFANSSPRVPGFRQSLQRFVTWFLQVALVCFQLLEKLKFCFLILNKRPVKNRASINKWSMKLNIRSFAIIYEGLHVCVGL